MKKNLGIVVDALVQEDTELAKKAFKDYLKEKTQYILEVSTGMPSDNTGCVVFDSGNDKWFLITDIPSDTTTDQFFELASNMAEDQIEDNVYNAVWDYLDSAKVEVTPRENMEQDNEIQSTTLKDYVQNIVDSIGEQNAENYYSNTNPDDHGPSLSDQHKDAWNSKFGPGGTHSHRNSSGITA